MQLTGKGAGRPLAGVVSALVVLALPLVGAPAVSAASTGTSTHSSISSTVYRNPVSRSFADTYADPDVVRGKDGWWYGYATSDPLRSGGERHLIPMSRSRDLVHWRFAGDAFSSATLPSWADTAHGASLWAPDVHYAGHGQWRMYYVVTETTVTADLGDNAIGMATATSPLGPWTDSGAPVVGPRTRAPGNYLWTFDPEWVRDTDGSEHIFYGSYNGGVFEQTLDPSGTQVKGDETRIAIDNKFEGTYITRKDGYWYFFGSTANCCAGPTTGYSVEVARSRNLTGPYVDKDGLRIDVGGDTGGTPVLYQNGNRWIGTGHNSMATDDRGQRWIVYHAIDRNNPFLVGATGVINRRPMLIDRIDWVHRWPVVRYGCGPSDSVQRGPAVRTWGKASPAGAPVSRGDCLEALASIGPGRLDRAASDEFNGSTLAPGWQQVRSPDITLAGGTLNWPTQRDDLVGPANTASILLRNAPRGNWWTVQTKLHLDLDTDDIRNYQQAGIIVYVNDDLFVRLDHVAIWNTRQSEFGKEMPYPDPVTGKPGLSYGGTIVGPPATTMWLRVVHRTNPSTGEHVLTPFTSRNGRTWTRGGSWTLPAGTALKIGLISQGANASDAPQATASFDYFHVYRP
jgi:arabinan endo-1,5-alpha-L-arabinosidase